MEQKVRIVVNGDLSQYRGGKEFLKTLQDEFILQMYEEEQWSNMTGPEMGDPFTSGVNFLFLISETFAALIGTYIAKEVGKAILKELLLEPFFDALEKMESLNEEINIDRLTFEYEDITIMIGYSRKNHINVVSMMSDQVAKHLSGLRDDDLGDLNLIATPVVKEEMEWKFLAPQAITPLSDFLINWGLEYNVSNRSVYHVKTRLVTYDYWWG
jgi:hypothetical protein